jgi:hypothetical protein
VSVALAIQHAKRTHHIILPSVACLALLHFSTQSHKRHYFRKKKVIERKMRVLISSTSFVWNSPHSKKNSARHCHQCENVFVLSTRYSCQILIELEFFEKYSNIKFSENPSSRCQFPCGRTDGQTHREANAPKNVTLTAHDMKAYVGDAQLQSLLTLAIYGDE